MKTLYNVTFLTQGIDQKTQKIGMVWKHYKTVETKKEVEKLRKIIMQQGYNCAVSQIT